MPPAEEPPAEEPPATCSIKGLVGFGPGLHKGELWSTERSARVPANFKYLTGTVPTAKLGHDLRQRFTQSLGFPNVGVVTRCDAVPGYPGVWDLDIDNVPTEVGGHANTGFFKAASVELNKQRDPADASRELEPVLTGISLLGEELPAVRNLPAELQERAKPHATFADGTPVPPADSASVRRFYEAMAKVAVAMAEEYGGEYRPETRSVRLRGREYADTVVCFSDFTPESAMTPEEIKAKLEAAGLPPELVAKCVAACGQMAAPAPGAPTGPPAGGAAPPAVEPPAAMSGNFGENCKKMSEDASRPEGERKMYAAFAAYAEGQDKEVGELKKEMSEHKKRMSESAAAIEETQKKDGEAKMAAFSAQVELDVNGKWDGTRCVEPGLARKHTAVVRDGIKRALLATFAPAAKTFATETDRLKAYRDELAVYARKPDDLTLAQAPAAVANPPAAAAGKPTVTPATPLLSQMVAPGGFLDRQVPGTARDIRSRVSA
jgi:hypothetical protein